MTATPAPETPWNLTIALDDRLQAALQARMAALEASLGHLGVEITPEMAVRAAILQPQAPPAPQAPLPQQFQAPAAPLPQQFQQFQAPQTLQTPQQPPFPVVPRLVDAGFTAQAPPAPVFAAPAAPTAPAGLLFPATATPQAPPAPVAPPTAPSPTDFFPTMAPTAPPSLQAPPANWQSYPPAMGDEEMHRWYAERGWNRYVATTPRGPATLYWSPSPQHRTLAPVPYDTALIPTLIPDYGPVHVVPDGWAMRGANFAEEREQGTTPQLRNSPGGGLPGKATVLS